MKQYALIFTLMLACFIPLKLHACKYDQDSTIISGKKDFNKNIPKSTNKTKTILSDVAGNDLTSKIKKVFLNGKQIEIHDTDSIKAKDIKSITTQQIKNGDIWLYIETIEFKTNRADRKHESMMLNILMLLCASSKQRNNASQSGQLIGKC
ncbi:MAG: hypothetical protein PHY69_10955 [Dysgonamonadaceae bacterium]|jgi:hypothetical protein|nr:hypothetical protein [Dysgonamonadaceae bacterium]